MLTYGSYLRLDDLLQLQEPVGPEPGTDERLFIVAHQVHELWFRLLLDALEEARDNLLAHELTRRSSTCRAPGTRRAHGVPAGFPTVNGRGCSVAWQSRRSGMGTSRR
jgi:hypothetical protein